MSAPEQREAQVGWREPEVAEELPGLCLVADEARLGEGAMLSGASPSAVRSRLAELSNPFNGAKAIHVRHQQVPAAYRAFFHQIGLDPEVRRTPIEAAILERMFDGAFVSRGLLEDVLLIALVDTAAPVWALDADTVDGPLGIRRSRPGEQLGGNGSGLPSEGGRLVVADSTAALAVLFDRPEGAHCAHGGSRRLVLYTVQVPGVPWLTVQEAIWICRSTLEAARPER